MNKEFVEIEGIICEVKNSVKKLLVKQYQHNLRIETDKYIGEQIMTDKRKGYASALEINIKIAPFVLGWLYKPGEDEYRVITGRMTLEEFNNKNNNTKPKKEPNKANKEPNIQKKIANKKTKKI